VTESELARTSELWVSEAKSQSPEPPGEGRLKVYDSGLAYEAGNSMRDSFWGRGRNLFALRLSAPELWNIIDPSSTFGPLLGINKLGSKTRGKKRKDAMSLT
jgi:hypothetical protein